MTIKETVRVEGMSCQHCVASVQGAVSALDGVSAVTVDLAGKTAEVQFDDTKVSLSAIKSAIEDQGYDVA